MQIIKLTVLIIMLSLSSCKSTKYNDLDDGLYADVQTNKGDIVLKLEYEKTPITVSNFVSLAEGNNAYVDEKFKGKPFYDGLKFHRVVKDFIVQGGDPRGNGSGGPGYRFEDEFPMDDSGNLLLSHDAAGTLSMANPGPDSNGSQFFITHKETKFLDGRHTVFGHVVIGQDVVDSIQKDDVIQKIEILRVGKSAKKFDAASVFNNYFKNIEEEQKEKIKRQEESKVKFLKFIEDNKAKATVLPSGLTIIKLKEGSGIKPKTGTKVNVYYAGYFTTGDLFDSNIKEVAQLHDKYNGTRDKKGGYKAIPMAYSPDAQLIPGFREGLQQMNYGDKIIALIPSHLAYGAQGARGVIPPNADLIFELEIVDDQK
jgi:cyclophilin family peptidyl-prolyl cis-trans isomerase